MVNMYDWYVETHYCIRCPERKQLKCCIKRFKKDKIVYCRKVIKLMRKRKDLFIC